MRRQRLIQERVRSTTQRLGRTWRPVWPAAAGAAGEAGDVQWYFERFGAGPDGTVAAGFRPTTAPDAPEGIAVIEKVLPR